MADAPADDKCPFCDKVVEGQAVTALNKNWHPEHFICTRCTQSLIGGESKQFFEKEGKPYCEKCYLKEFAPKCAKCSDPIKGKAVTALEQHWHPEHFQCSKCEKVIPTDSKFKSYNKKAFCEACPPA